MIVDKDDVAQHLRNHDISPSYPRKRILEYLIERHNHPTVATIYQDLVDEIPSLSKTTVYNTLKLFCERHIVEEITIEGNEKRYDLFNPQLHAHFRCDRCGHLYDIELSQPIGHSAELKGFTVRQQSIHFSGICPECDGAA
jgi:Fe2+ or Zn2+ uptake regulation protein